MDMRTTERAREEYVRKYASLSAKIARFVEARRIAEQAFAKLEAMPAREWEAFCDANGLHTCVDFGDLTC